MLVSLGIASISSSESMMQFLRERVCDLYKKLRDDNCLDQMNSKLESNEYIDLELSREYFWIGILEFYRQHAKVKHLNCTYFYVKKFYI